MENTQPNPLSKYFRQPAIYINLPSAGRYWTTNSLDLPVSGQIPVYPMTSRDEITLRTPDALMNGVSMVDVMHSCCPNIVDPWMMPSIDVDTILIAIRIASYGSTMDVDTKCPKCEEENRHEADLQALIATIKPGDYSAPVESEGLRIWLKPQRFKDINDQNLTAFEEQRMLRLASDTSLNDEERINSINNSMSKLLELNINSLVMSTEKILTPDNIEVTDTNHIKDFYNNANSVIIRAIQNRLKDIAEQTAIPPLTVSCSSCENIYQVPLEFDYSNFFANGS